MVAPVVKDIGLNIDIFVYIFFTFVRFAGKGTCKLGSLTVPIGKRDI
jgi:hypothetical protein